MLTFFRYIEVYFTFAFWIVFVKSRLVISRFCSIHFIVILAGLKNIIRYIEDSLDIEPVSKGRLRKRYYAPPGTNRSHWVSFALILPWEVHPKNTLVKLGRKRTSSFSWAPYCLNLSRLMLWVKSGSAKFCTCIMTDKNEFFINLFTKWHCDITHL